MVWLLPINIVIVPLFSLTLGFVTFNIQSLAFLSIININTLINAITILIALLVGFTLMVFIVI